MLFEVLNSNSVRDPSAFLHKPGTRVTARALCLPKTLFSRFRTNIVTLSWDPEENSRNNNSPATPKRRQLLGQVASLHGHSVAVPHSHKDAHLARVAESTRAVCVHIPLSAFFGML